LFFVFSTSRDKKQPTTTATTASEQRATATMTSRYGWLATAAAALSLGTITSTVSAGRVTGRTKALREDLDHGLAEAEGIVSSPGQPFQFEAGDRADRNLKGVIDYDFYFVAESVDVLSPLTTDIKVYRAMGTSNEIEPVVTVDGFAPFRLHISCSDDFDLV
jgi:hypothetical protein